ncbi:MAG: DUF368 domain-containing protein [Lentisphaeria bacterium]|nr:DUF368 domain-containing protein [Lentisphaeria bacterium]
MENKKKRSPLGYFGLYVIGVIVGAADVIPGVSGGTMAFILGIYEEMLNAIRSFASMRAVKMFANFKLKGAYRSLPWPFVLVLLLGVGSAAVLLAKPITWMLENRLSFILAFFFGLVAASVITVLCRVGKFNVLLIPGLAAGTAIGWWVAGLTEGMQSPPDSWWYLVLCGAVAICAMILPGISGSFILMLMGHYNTVMEAIKGMTGFRDVSDNLRILGCFFLGIVVGLASFAQLLSWMFKRWRNLTIVVLAGFMIGSLRKIWPWKLDDSFKGSNVLPEIDLNFWIAVALAVVGFALVVAIELAARSFEMRQKAAGKTSK